MSSRTPRARCKWPPSEARSHRSCFLLTASPVTSLPLLNKLLRFLFMLHWSSGHACPLSLSAAWTERKIVMTRPPECTCTRLCVHSASQFSPWKLQLGELNWQLEDIITQMVLVIADTWTLWGEEDEDDDDWINTWELCWVCVSFSLFLPRQELLTFQRAGLWRRC